MSATAVKDFIRRLLNKMLPKTDFEKKLNVKIATSNIMDNAIKLWLEWQELAISENIHRI